MIIFHGGHQISNLDLAAAIRCGGKLGRHRSYDPLTGLFCAVGVAKAELGIPQETIIRSTGNLHLAFRNDTFVGTPEERAEFIAQLLEANPDGTG